MFFGTSVGEQAGRGPVTYISMFTSMNDGSEWLLLGVKDRVKSCLAINGDSGSLSEYGEHFGEDDK